MSVLPGIHEHHHRVRDVGRARPPDPRRGRVAMAVSGFGARGRPRIPCRCNLTAETARPSTSVPFTSAPAVLGARHSPDSAKPPPEDAARSVKSRPDSHPDSAGAGPAPPCPVRRGRAIGALWSFEGGSPRGTPDHRDPWLSHDPTPHPHARRHEPARDSQTRPRSESGEASAGLLGSMALVPERSDARSMLRLSPSRSLARRGWCRPAPAPGEPRGTADHAASAITGIL